ncbi:eCIS core domain-containing protein [Pseudanabaena sp. UWO311]|uniref:eCIS core domain-containing protein n=1 Tax=Pseudanabaena sp. UWO311 TaxID=2487337 RepID=UPI001CC1C605|nr:DUF4157 domain-containing protein [Pseudanabaena sp. UWO311]
MGHTNDRSTKASSLVNPTSLNLQPRPFAALESDEKEEAISRKSGYSENFLEKIINTPRSESATPIQRKSGNRLKAITTERNNASLQNQPIQRQEAVEEEKSEGEQEDTKEFTMNPEPPPVQRKFENRLRAKNAQRMAIQAKLAIGEPNDKYEQEADATAARVVQQINSPTTSQSQPVQRKFENRLRAKNAQKMALQAKLAIGEPNDKYEQEADATAARVVQQINSSIPSQSQPIQRQEMEEDEELQMKPFVQRSENIGGGEASTDLESAIQSARGGGQSLDANLQQSMGQAMGADFSGVKVHTDSQSDQLNKSIQAKAFTTGQDLFFRQGAYEPSSRGGQELIAHELTHVVQQNGGAVQRSPIACNQNQTQSSKNIQRYVEAGEIAKTPESPAQKEALLLPEKTRISESRNTIVILKDDNPSGSDEMYAESSLISGANDKLASAGNSGSVVSLTGGAKKTFFGAELSKVEPKSEARKGFTDMNEANNPVNSEKYDESTQDMVSPLEKISNQVTSNQTLSRPSSPQEVQAVLVFTTNELNSKIKETGEDGTVELSEKEADEINKKIVARITQIKQMRGQGGDAKLVLYKECIKAAHAIMGVRELGQDSAVYNEEDESQLTKAEDRGAGGLKSLTKALQELVQDKFGEEYFGYLSKPETELGEEEKKKLIATERELGFNRGANPEIGEAYATVSNEWEDNFQKFEDAGGTWNQHWAAVVMKDGGDNVTLENAADNPVNMDRAWWFQMYGTEKDGQTFHEQSMASKWFGNMATTLQIRPEKDIVLGGGSNLKTFDSNVENVKAFKDKTIKEIAKEKDNYSYLDFDLQDIAIYEVLQRGLAYALYHVRHNKKGRKTRVNGWIDALEKFIKTKGVDLPDSNNELTGKQFNVKMAVHILVEMKKVNVFS